MLSTVGVRISLLSHSPRILYVCQRHMNLEEFMKGLKKPKRRTNYEAFTEEKPDIIDPLEFRNIAEFKETMFHGERGHRSLSLSFLKKNSILRDVRARSMIDTLKNISAKTKVKDQAYNPERVQSLGPDLAAAHFIVCRGGGVKFVGEDKFIRGKVNRSNEVLPNTNDPHIKVEAIDFSKGDFVYEAISHLADLKYLSWVGFRNCKYVDNWFLDHLSSVAPSVEYIDLTGCHKVDQFGLSCFYRFKKLKCVNVEDVSEKMEFNLACLTMEAELPDFVFIGLKLKPTPKSVFND